MKNRKKIVIVIISIMLISLIGGAYAWFNYYRTGSNNNLIISDLYLYFGDGNDDILINNIYPESAQEARSHNLEDNVLSFTINGKNTTDKTIYYEIKLLYGNEKEAPYERFRDEDLLFDLIEIDENNDETYLLSAVNFDEINNTRIWVDTIDAETNNRISKRYKLRMWLKEDVLISDTDSKRSYCATDYCVENERAFKYHYASIKIAVYGDLIEKDLHNLYQVVKNDVSKGYAVKYLDETQDTIDGRGRQDVYYYRGEVRNKNENSDIYNETMNNVIFGNFCWQMVRTTDTGGVKMIYNGRPVEGKCLNDQFDSTGKIKSGRDNQLGILSSERTSITLSDNSYAYGTSYKITEDNKFKLSGNIFNDTWSSNNYDNLINKYTCKDINSDNNCTTLYLVNSYNNVNKANVIPLTVGETHYSQIGTSRYNILEDSLSGVGYMYNDVYIKRNTNNNNDNLTNKNYVFANSYIYRDGIYYLNLDEGEENKKIINDWPTEYNLLNNTHYTCFNSTGECENSIYYVFSTSSNIASYIELKNGEVISTAVEKMIHSDNVNKNNSTIKEFIDKWFENTLINYTEYLEDTIYCNDRTLLTSGNNSYENSGWNPNGGKTNVYIQFETANSRYKLSCSSVLDSFSVSNNKAKLKYPVALLTSDEALLSYRNINHRISYLRTGNHFKLISPAVYNSSAAGARIVESSGAVIGYGSYYNRGIEGVRPVISLKYTNEFIQGNGSESNPYIIKTEGE